MKRSIEKVEASDQLTKRGRTGLSQEEQEKLNKELTDFFSSVSFKEMDRHKAAEVVETMLKEGSNANAVVGKYYDNTTALIIASKNNQPEVVKVLLSAGAKVNDTDCSGWTALMFAARKGNIEVAQILLKEEDIDVTIVDSDKRTAFMIAAFCDETEMVQMLLKEKNIKVNDADKSGYTSLMQSSQQGYTEVVRALLGAKDVDVNQEVSSYGNETALMLASWHKHMEVIELLLNAGADVKAVNKKGQTAFLCAAQDGKTAGLPILLERGSDVNATDSEGHNAMMTALQQDYRGSMLGTIVNSAAAVQTNEGEDWEIFAEEFQSLKNSELNTASQLLTRESNLLLDVILPQKHSQSSATVSQTSPEAKLRSLQSSLKEEGLTEYQQRMALAAALNFSSGLKNTSTYLSAILPDDGKFGVLKTTIINAFNEQNPNNHIELEKINVLNSLVRNLTNHQDDKQQRVAQYTKESYKKAGRYVSQLLEDPDLFEEVKDKLSSISLNPSSQREGQIDVLFIKKNLNSNVSSPAASNNKDMLDLDKLSIADQQQSNQSSSSSSSSNQTRKDPSSTPRNTSHSPGVNTRNSTKGR